MNTLKKILMAAAMGAGLYACQGCDPGNNNNNSNNHPPASFTQSDVAEPVEGSTYQIGQMVPVDFTVPVDEDGDSLEAVVELLVDDDGTPGPSAGDTKVTKDLGTFQSGNQVVNSIDTTGLPAGDGYVIMTVSDSKGGESSLERKVALTPAQAFDFACEVQSAAVGAGFSMSCTSQQTGLTYSHLSTTLQDSGMNPSGTAGTVRTLTDADIGVHNMEIKASHSTLGEVTKTVYFSIDKHRSQIRGCDGQTYLVPEVTADSVASACIPGYNASLKPTSQGSDYTLDLSDLTCAKNTLANATAQEKQSWESYEKNPETMFDGCTTTQVVYRSLE